MEPIRFFGADNQWGELSNFWLLSTPIVHQGKTYTTSEHLYQAMKFMGSNVTPLSLEYIELIRKANTPYKAKLLAGLSTLDRYEWQAQIAEIVKRYKARGIAIRPDWDEETKIKAMLDVLVSKFSTDARAREVLLSTGESPLIEGSPYDTFWGEGKYKNGKNWLGILLMRVRKAIRERQ